MTSSGGEIPSGPVGATLGYFEVMAPIGDVQCRWTFGDVVEVMMGDDLVKAALVSNVTKGVLETIGEYCGVKFSSGVNILTEQHRLVPEILVVGEVLEFHWLEQCCEFSAMLPSPVSSPMNMCVNMAMYVWVGCLRIPPQDFTFLNRPNLLWRAVCDKTLDFNFPPVELADRGTPMRCG